MTFNIICHPRYNHLCEINKKFETFRKVKTVFTYQDQFHKHIGNTVRRHLETDQI